jgi:hypothetical protein
VAEPWAREAEFQHDRRSVAAAEAQRRVQLQYHPHPDCVAAAVVLSAHALRTTALHVLTAAMPLLARCTQVGASPRRHRAA